MKLMLLLICISYSLSTSYRPGNDLERCVILLQNIHFYKTLRFSSRKDRHLTLKRDLTTNYETINNNINLLTYGLIIREG